MRGKRRRSRGEGEGEKRGKGMGEEGTRREERGKKERRTPHLS